MGNSRRSPSARFVAVREWKAPHHPRLLPPCLSYDSAEQPPLPLVHKNKASRRLFQILPPLHHCSSNWRGPLRSLWCDRYICAMAFVMPTGYFVIIGILCRSRCVASSVLTKAKLEVSQQSTSGKTIASLPTLTLRLLQHQLNQRRRMRRPYQLKFGQERPHQHQLQHLL